MKISKEELNTMISLVVFGAGITIQQDDNCKTSTKLRIAEMIENLDTVNCIQNTTRIVDLAAKLKEHIETNFKENN